MTSNHPLRQHIDHTWMKVGACVYCGTCGIPLYQGDVSKDEHEREGFVEALDHMMKLAIESME